jgi:hypothetical protein
VCTMERAKAIVVEMMMLMMMAGAGGTGSDIHTHTINPPNQPTNRSTAHASTHTQ